MKRKIVIKLWYDMTFNKNANAKLLFEMIEGFYEITDNYMSLIITKNSY